MQARQHKGRGKRPAAMPNLSRERAGMNGLSGSRENKEETSMNKKVLLVGMVAVGLFAGISSLQMKGSQARSGAATDDQATREIAEQINMRHAALGRFDRNAYSAFVDQSTVFAEPGEIESGNQYMTEIHPTVGFKRTVEHETPKVTSFGQTAVAVYAQTEKEIYGQQSLTFHVKVVDTYTKKDGSWVLIAHVELPEPLKRQSVKVSPTILSQYAGQYEYGPGFMDAISVDGGKLMSQETGEDKPTELLALNETTFFVDNDGEESLTTFEKGASGTVSQYVLHEKGQELIAKKIK
jgi:hypothetical protein